jgi:NADH oxidase (H2O2-forming)
VGRRLVPKGPEAVVVNIAKSSRLPKTMLGDLITGNVTSLDLEKREALVKTGEGEVVVGFEKLILAVGAVPWVPQTPGALKEEGPFMGAGILYGNDWVDKGRLADNVHVLRGAPDARRLDELANSGKSAVVVGSGAIGLEVVEALHDRGMKVTLLEVLDHLAVALDADVAVEVEKRVVEKGVVVYKGKGAIVKKINKDSVELENGTTIPCDGIVFSTGVRPDLRLAKEAGIKVEKGIVVDAGMKTSAEGVYAIGDVAQITDGATGLPLLPLVGTLSMRHAASVVSDIAGSPIPLAPATIWGVSAIFDLSWGSVGWTAEIAARVGIPVESVLLPITTRDDIMPKGRPGIWKLVVVSAPFQDLKVGQIVGFQAVQDEDSTLGVVERFIDIISRRETVSDLFGHYFIHNPYHNAVDDNYMKFFFKAMQLFPKS